MTPTVEQEIVSEPLPVHESSAHTGIMSVIDETGDTQIKWNRRNPPEVEMARTAFNTMRGKGYAAYKTNAAGAQCEVITSFDPNAESIIFAPPMVGG